MIWSDYWGALSSRQRAGLIAGTAMILAAMAGLAAWLFRDPYVPLANGLTGEQLSSVAQELERSKLSYRVDGSGDAITVRQSELGKARAAMASGDLGVPPAVGLELFKETDFSSTDFAQRVNYQRALQGELTRTIQTISGVRSARVHVILPEGGLFKRNGAKASAAVSVALLPGNRLTQAQVRGIQRLVAASVPEIQIDDVVVLDESGTSLTRTRAEGEGDLSSAQLDLKRQADQYLESKLARLLEQLVPQGTASLSVDTTLDYRQLRVTTEEPIAVPGSASKQHATGVLVKERQSQRGRAAGLMQASDYDNDVAGDAESTDREYEYKVGHRLEQTLSNPGSIRRVSVAVALRAASAELSAAAIEELIAHAVGLDRSRGDSVAVMLLPASQMSTTHQQAPASAPVVNREDSGNLQWRQQAGTHLNWPAVPAWVLAAAVALAFGLSVGAWVVLRRSARARSQAEVNIDEVTAKVRQWLSEGGGDGRV